MNVDLLLDRLDKVRSSGSDQWVACCPAHNDRSPTLAISLCDDRVLIHCFAGCSPLQILTAVGLDWSALFPAADKQLKPKKSPVSYRLALNVLAGEMWIGLYVMSRFRQGIAPNEEEMNRFIEALRRISKVFELTGLRYER